jgi:predicted lipoprotein
LQPFWTRALLDDNRDVLESLVNELGQIVERLRDQRFKCLDRTGRRDPQPRRSVSVKALAAGAHRPSGMATASSIDNATSRPTTM